MLFSAAERKQCDSKILGTATVEVESKPVGKRKSTRIAAIEEKKKMTFTEENCQVLCNFVMAIIISFHIIGTWYSYM